MNGSAQPSVFGFEGYTRSRSPHPPVSRLKRFRAADMLFGGPGPAEIRHPLARLHVPCAGHADALLYPGFGSEFVDLFRRQSAPHKMCFVLPPHPDARSIDLALDFASARISAVNSANVAWYIGIAENPGRRWQQHQASGAAWARFQILVQARSSRVTSLLEQRLLLKFGGGWYK